MAVLTFAIETKDKSSPTIQNVANSFSNLKAKVEIAANSLKSVKAGFLNVAAGVGGVITILQTGMKIFSQIDKTISSMGGEAKANWDELKVIFNNVFNVVLKNATKVIADVVRAIKDFINNSTNLETIANIISGLGAQFEILKEVFKTLFNVIQQTIITAFQDLQNDLGGLLKNFDALDVVLTGIKAGVIAVSVVFNVLTNTIKMVIVGVVDLANALGSLGELLGNVFTGQWDKVSKAAEKVRDSFAKFGTNIKDNFGDVIDGAKKTYEAIDKGFDVKKTKEKFVETFKKTKEETKKNLKDITKINEDTNKKMIEDDLIFTNELKGIYEKYVKLKEDLNNKEYKDEQEYFNKINELRQLEATKGLKELEDYYSKQNEITEKNKSEMLKKIATIFGAIDFEKGISGVENAISTIIAKITNTINTVAANIVTNIASFMENMEKATNKVDKIKLKVSFVMQTIADAFKIASATVTEIFSFLTKQTEAELKEIQSKYEKMFKDIEDKQNKALQQLEEQKNKELDILEDANKTEIERAQEKLEELKKLREDFRDEEAQQRLEELENYYQALDNKTDADIQAAYERQKAKILETEETKRLNLEQQISEQQKAIKRLQIEEEYNKKKAEIEASFRKQKEEAEKQKQNELNEKEKQIFEANKANQIANVWIATATGIATAWASAMQLGVIAAPIVAGVLTGLLLTNAGIQTGLIAAQNYTPKNFATGGIVVGEAGREIVELPRGTQVLNNDKTEQILGNKEITLINQIFLDSTKIEEVLIKKRLNLLTR